ncbi:fatty acid desaturase family protein [Serratia ureilytica]|uniref:fatty acid desaturase family protein n=1 Tax=Serratia ureilytica TaxID=300181 RepID=UPI001D18D191|nr:fatty acid desaturase [Serratia ureilytica]MCC4106270.1 fatty acid desaturase [Serratia ureilytica]
MFKHSIRDGILVVLCALHIVFWIVPVIYYNQLSIISLLLFAVVNIALMCTNYQCIAHNFIHNPFFKSTLLNNAFSIANSIALGMPQSFYKVHHINHHTYNNDDWCNGVPPGDKSSLFYYGRNGGQEGMLRYTALSYFRLSLIQLFKDGYQRTGRLVLFEVLAVLVFMAVLGCINSWAFLVFVIPVHYLGTSMASLENYAEHHECEPDNALSNSVSCYSSWYNFLWFNNGYHQEHHCEPGLHWTRLPKARERMLSSQQRKVVKGCHLISLFTVRK